MSMTKNELMEYFPPMLLGEELDEAMRYLPKYNPDICHLDAGIRLRQLDKLKEIYIPSKMSQEIYVKLYLAMVRSLEKKHTVESIRQGVQNHRRIMGLDNNSVLGGSDSFSIIGKSGIGKSTAIARGLQVAGGTEIITHGFSAGIIPCVNIQCPQDCSVKGLLLSVLGSVDDILGTEYQKRATRSRATLDNLIGMVSQVAVNHILLIVVDECQNIVRNKHGINVVSTLTQLINSSGVSICLVGLPETELFFQEEMQLARRSIGLSYREFPCDDFFVSFCQQVFPYQYVANRVPLTSGIIETLYQCSGGIIGIVLSLLIESQQVAITTGQEIITPELLLETFAGRMHNIQDFVEVRKEKRPQTATIEKKKNPESEKSHGREQSVSGANLQEGVISVVAERTLEENADMISLLGKSGICITEVVA